MTFYDNIASFYNDMTGFDERLNREKPVMQKWVEKYHIKTAIDTACGTGLHSILLTELGVHTTGTDISAEMLEIARNKAKERGVKTEFKQLAFTQSGDLTQSDALFCLGNSLPHILDQQELVQTLKTFASLLNSNGTLVLQLLNYEKILKDQERIVGITWRNDFQYIRFYDFFPGLQFNILTIHKKSGEHSINSVLLKPYTAADICPILEQLKMRNIELAGDMNFTPFSQKTSKNLIITATK